MDDKNVQITGTERAKRKKSMPLSHDLDWNRFLSQENSRGPGERLDALDMFNCSLNGLEASKQGQ
jgi:hypothetical protein